VSDIFVPLSVTQLGHASDRQRWRTEALHAYDDHTIYWFTKGQGHLNVAGQSLVYGPNTVVFIPAGTTHAVELRALCFATQIRIRDLPEVSLPETTVHIRLRDRMRQVPFVALVEGAQREVIGENIAADQAALGYAHLFAAWLTRERAAADKTKSHAADRLVARYCALLESRYASGATVSELAQELGVTATHLSRCCRKTCGKSAHDLFSDRLMYEARALLAQTELPVKRIAVDLGFSSAAYFTRAFQTETGLTPTSFRDLQAA